MKDCTGPRWEGETLNNASLSGWHGKYGHLNLLILDHDDVVTGFGAHDRVVVFCPDAEGLYCRVDHLWGLGMPTPDQVLKVAKAWPNNLKGKWELDAIVKGEKSTDFYFKRKI